MNVSQLPNLITLSRIVAAPILILTLKAENYVIALVVFSLAGVSDALDGWIAKRYHYVSRFGAILDPIADKILLVSCYVMLMLLGQLPFWLVLTVAFRDLLIIGGYLVYTQVVGTVHVSPTLLSKSNTVAQILLALAVLLQKASGVTYVPLIDALISLVFVTTIASGVHYVWVWGVVKHKKPPAENPP